MGLSQAEVARRAGTNQQTVDRIESGKIQHSRFLVPIAAALGLRLDDVLDVPAQQVPRTGAPALVGAKDLPVHGAAEGGRGTLIVTSDPVDFEWRPAPLAGVRDAYGLIVVGTSMVPEYEPGDVALVHPHLAPTRDVTCVFYAEAPGEVRATIKRLTRVTETAWHVHQWNPPEGQKADFTLQRREWTKCHRILGRYNRR
jgi:phage repressor protein C with HTH and peptisase S24 domain/DNA-binding XRE family transcriptional regulator